MAEVNIYFTILIILKIHLNLWVCVCFEIKLFMNQITVNYSSATICCKITVGMLVVVDGDTTIVAF